MRLFSWKLSRWRVKAIKAFCAFLALALVLAMVFAQHQPYKYIVSHVALRDAFLQNDLSEMVTDSSGIWKWFDAVVSSANSRELNNVEANCAYEIPLLRDVEIENTSYTLYDPSVQDHACKRGQYPVMTVDESGVILRGNHEILTFGLFQSRSLKKYSKEMSQGRNLPGRPILTPDSVSYDPATDNRVIEVCELLTTSSTEPQLCLSGDGFAGELGSSFSWKGKYFDSLGRAAFDHSNEARYMMIPQKPFTPIEPCFSYNSSTQELINEPHEENISNCTYYWTTPGTAMRTSCLLDFDNQPSSIFAFLAYRLGLPSVFQLSNFFMGCSTLVNTPIHELSKFYVSTAVAIQSNLENEDMFGTFFLTENNLKWVAFAKFYTKQLIMHRFIDENTRKVSVFTILRNLGDEDLFYALVTVTFLIGVSGQISHSFDVQYIPIIQYYYGLDGYPYIRNEVIVSELLFLCPFILTVISVICFKVYNRYIAPAKDLTAFEGCKSKNDEGTSSQELDPFGLPLPPPLSVTTTRDSRAATLLGDESEEGFDISSDSADEDSSDVKVRLSLQRRRNRNLSKKMEKSNVSDISLKDFSSILLPDVEDLENVSSTSEESDTTESDEDFSDEADDIITSARKIPRKSLSVLKRQVSVVTKRSTKSIKTVTKIIKKKKTKKYKKYFSLCVIVMFIITFCCRLLYIDGARDLHNFLTSSELVEPTDTQFSGYDVHFEEIFEKFKQIQRYEIVGRTLSVACIFFFVTQFFSYLTFDKRFNLVTSTLTKAVRDIVPMLIILVSVLLTYSALGGVIYGHSIEDFSTLGQSLSSLLIVMLGEVAIYEKMKEKNMVLTMIFFWSFVVLVVFIIFNMVLALIFTLYDEEYRDMKSQKEKKRLEALAEAEKRERERIAAIKRRKFVRRNKISVRSKK